VSYLADSLYHSVTTGVTRYAVQLAQELDRIPDIDLLLFTLMPAEVVAALAQKRGYPEAESVPLRFSRNMYYLLWHLARVSGPLGKAASASAFTADVLHTPTFLIPPQKKSPLVVTVYDLTLLRFPHHFSRNTRILLGTGLRRALRDADAFLAISEYTKQDLIRLTGVSPSRVFVTPLAADARFKPVSGTETLARYQIQTPYILYVGTLELRKNVAVLLRAFAALNNKSLTLVLAGIKGIGFDDLLPIIQQLGISEQIVVTGYVADEDLPALYSQARVFVYPSLFEGFGLPVLEAMQCGTPVITTNVSSLPEVAGKAALLFAPDDVAALVDALQQVLSAPGVREEMRGRSLEQASRFSWRRTAELTAEAYQYAAQ